MALFVEVVRTKSFSRAAEALDVPISSLSRRIAELEKAVGLRLLNRTTRKVELTEAGAAYFNRCQSIVDTARVAHEDLSEMVTLPRGHLRISTSGDFAVLYLAPLLVEFRARYPDISFEIDTSQRVVDLLAEHFDVALRVGVVAESALIAQRLAMLPVQLYAAPGFLATLAASPQVPGDLQTCSCIRFGVMPDSATWSLLRGGECANVPVSGAYTVTSIGLVRQLALLGVGIGVMDAAMVAEDIQAGRLVRVLPDWELKPLPVHALTASRLLPAKTRMFIDFLMARMNGDHLESISVS